MRLRQPGKSKSIKIKDDLSEKIKHAILTAKVALEDLVLHVVKRSMRRHYEFLRKENEELKRKLERTRLSLDKKTFPKKGKSSTGRRNQAKSNEDDKVFLSMEDFVDEHTLLLTGKSPSSRPGDASCGPN